MARAGKQAAGVVVGLFFVMQAPAAIESSAGEQNGAGPEVQELRLAVAALQQQNALLRQRLQQQEQRLAALRESLAIARTESDLFQQRWTEAQLRAQVLGIEPADAEAQDWQRQLLESVRALYLAEMERQRLVKQLEALVAAAEAGDDRLPLVMEETRDVLREQRDQAGGPDKTSGPVPTLAAAQVLDVNPDLAVVVLNVGRQQGARVGMPFVLLEADRVVARVRVVEVRRHLSAALIEENRGNRVLEAGLAARVTASE